MIDSVKAILKRYVKKDSLPWIISRASLNFIIKCLNLPNYHSELSFWESWLSENWERISCPETQKIIFPKPLLTFISKLHDKGCANLELLEVGSGPVSLLAWGVNENLFHVVAIDALADSYEKIMKKNKYSYPIKPIKGYGEKIRNVVNAKVFDLVYSSNALDHVVSPKKCLSNMVEVLKDGGYIVLEGYVNEGILEHFSGLHKYNLEPINGHLFCTDKKNRTVNLTKETGLKCVYQEIVKARERASDTPFVRHCDDKWYTIIFQKVFLSTPGWPLGQVAREQ